MRKINLLFLSLMLVLITVLTSCDKKSPATPLPPTQASSIADTEVPAAIEAPTPEPTLPANEDPGALMPDPQPITFTTEDGTQISGYYYPGGKDPSPLVVFMHWMNGDQNDWNEVAVWLQNRGLENPFPNPGDLPWWDPSWFPAVPADRSYAVMVFSFRNCLPYRDGCQSVNKEGWLKDAQAAMLKAYELEGIDQTRITAIGSSIGADGAPYGCQKLNEMHPDACQGALSLSPGSYLGIPYEKTVKDLGLNDPATAAWCLADQSEYFFCEIAESANNPAYQDFMIQNGSHGNMLLSPKLDPLPMQIILDFLVETLK